MQPLFRAVWVLGQPSTLALVAFPSGPKAPTPPAPTPMPDLEDPAILLAQKRVREQAAARSGRASTVLSGGSDDYSGTKLGTA